MRVSGGDLCTKCRSTDRAGRRDQVLLPLPKQKDTCGCLFCFAVKAERLEPRNSKVLALLTVNSPVDCLRIELIIKPLPKKAPNFRCFFPLFTLFYCDFTCFFHIDKITAHGLFRTPSFHFHTVFLFTMCHTIHAIRLVHHQKSINHKSNSLVIIFSFYLIFHSLCEFIYADLTLFGNSSGIILFILSSLPSLIASL